jgi:hypothetical protein
MTDLKKPNLRIVCLCGQKMQVAPSMYGSPADCVSCKQKLFIPEEHEIGEDTRIIYLRDHLELLRKPGVYVRDNIPEKKVLSSDLQESSKSAGNSKISFLKESATEASKKDESSEFDLFFQDTLIGSKSNASVYSSESNIPLDSFEPLQKWAGYSKALNRARHSQSPEQEEYFEQLELDLENALLNIKNYLAEEIEDSKKKIAEIAQEIADFALSLSNGDVALAYYQQQVRELRLQREFLARKLYNLECWFEYSPDAILFPPAEVTLEDFDRRQFKGGFEFSQWPHPSTPLSSYYCSLLKDSFENKDRLSQQIKTEKQLLASTEPVATEAASLLSRTHCQIHFCRIRLEKIIEDCDLDLRSFIKCQITLLDEIPRNKAEWRKTKSLTSALQAETRNLIARQEELEVFFKASSPEDLKTGVTAAPAPDANETTFFPIVQIFALSLATCSFLCFFFILHLVDPDLPVLPALLPSFLLFSHLLLLWRSVWVRSLPFVLLFWLLEMAASAYSLFYLQGKITVVPTDTAVLNNFALYLFPAGAALINGGNMSAFIAMVHRKIREKMAVQFITFLVVTVAVFIAFISVKDVNALFSPAFTTQDKTLSQNLVTNTPPNPSEKIPLPRTYSQEIITDAETEDADDVSEEDDMSSAEGEATAPLRDNEMRFHLNGVVHVPGKDPRFRGVLQHPDGTEESVSLLLGEQVVGNWVASEYDPAGKKLIVSDGKTLLVLQAGKSVSLPSEEEE